MLEWLADASPLDRTFALCAALGAALFVVRMGLQLLGGDAGDGLDLGAVVDGAEASFQFLSFHSINGFVLIFGLVGLAMRIENGAGEGASLLAAAVAGVAAMALIGFLSLQLQKLQSSGNVRLTNAIGAIGDVYLTIPAEGSGQVRVAFQNKLQIVDAISTSATPLPTGARVKVVGVFSPSTVQVEPLEAEG